MGCSISQPLTLKPFVSDGCTCCPDGTFTEPILWRSECVAHDLAYWKGGTRLQRLDADRALRQGIIEKGYPVRATLIYLGTRLGGVPYVPTPWRWGFGWPFPRAYGELSTAERREATRRLSSCADEAS